MRRLHRTTWEHFLYLAIYECPECHSEEVVPRQYRYHMGPEIRCPRCGTYRLSKLKERDKIDKMAGGIVNLIERLFGGKLYHCCFCRLQFYDRRQLAQRPRDPVANTATNQQDTAISGA